MNEFVFTTAGINLENYICIHVYINGMVLQRMLPYNKMNFVSYERQ